MQDLRVLVLEQGQAHPQICTKTWASTVERLCAGTIRIAFEEAYVRLGLTGFQNWLRSLVIEQRVNLIVIFESLTAGLEPEFLAELRQRAFICVYYCDTLRNFRDWYVYSAQGVDLALTDSYYGASFFKAHAIDARFFPSSFDGGFFKPLPGVVQDIDVSFVGVAHNKRNRQKYLRALRGNRVDVRIFGSDSAEGFVTYEGMVEIFNRSRINLNFTGIEVERGRPRIERRITIPKARCQEIALTGGFVLTEYADELRYLFDLGTEIETFDSERELCDKIGYFLAHPDEREEIAIRGRARALREHEAVAAVGSMLADVVEKMQTRQGARFDLVFDDAYFRHCLRYHAIALARMIAAGKLKPALEEAGFLFGFPRFLPVNLWHALVEGGKVLFRRFPKIREPLLRLVQRVRRAVGT